MADITLTSTTNSRDELHKALGIEQVTLQDPETPAPVVAPAAEIPPAPAVEDPDDADEDAEPHPQQQQAGRKRGRLQKRIDDLVAKTRQFEGLTAAQDAELIALRRRVSEMTTAPAAAPVDAPAVVVPVKPTVEQFATYEDYTEAIAKWAAKVARMEADADYEAKQAKAKDSALKEQQEAEQRRAEQQRAEAEAAYRTGLETVRGKYDDFDEVVNDPTARVSDLMIHQILMASVEDQAKGAEIAYYLGKHPEMRSKLFELGNTPAALKAFGKLEARVEASLEAADKSAPVSTAASPERPATLGTVAPAAVRPVTKAPDPITPVGGGATTGNTNPDAMSYQEFRTWRQASAAKRAGLK